MYRLESPSSSVLGSLLRPRPLRLAPEAAELNESKTSLHFACLFLLNLSCVLFDTKTNFRKNAMMIRLNKIHEPILANKVDASNTAPSRSD